MNVAGVEIEPLCRHLRVGCSVHTARVVHLSVGTHVTDQCTVHGCRAFLDLGGGLSVGFSGLSAGFAIGIVGDAGVRGTAQQPRLFVGMILILIFAEVLGEPLINTPTHAVMVYDGMFLTDCEWCCSSNV